MVTAYVYAKNANKTTDTLQLFYVKKMKFKTIPRVGDDILVNIINSSSGNEYEAICKVSGVLHVHEGEPRVVLSDKSHMSVFPNHVWVDADEDSVVGSR